MSLTKTVQDNQLLAAALHYAQRGWRVLPLHSVEAGQCTCGKADCTSKGKHPLLPNGSKGATTDENTIVGWWEEAPTANVGIATGPESGLFMIGPDGNAGIVALTELEAKHGQLPLTPRLRSGGSGEHYYFKYPSEGTIKTGANLNGLPIDVRGQGGLVVAVPSLHLSGRRYEWLTPPDEVELAEAPPWLLEWLRAGKSSKLKPSTNGSLTLKVQADDLASAPGVRQGQRHATALRLIGLHLGRSEAAEKVRQEALAWAARCEPPLEAEDIERIVTDLAAKEAACGEGAEADEDLDAVPLPEPPPWPTLDAHALHGLAGDILGELAPHTEADPVALLIQLLTAFGNVVGRHAPYVIEGCPHYGNLFTCLVGESSRGRKGTARGRILQLFEAADADWSKKCQAHGLSSGEGVIWSVRDAIEKTEPVKSKGSIVGYQPLIVDQGVADKRLLVLESEFAQALRVMRRESNTLSPVLREAWDTGDLRTLVKHNPARATGAHISIIGHVTRPELVRHLHETEMLNGFANRFLWPLVRRSKLLPDGGGDINLGPLQQRLRQACDFSRQVGQLKRSEAAAKLWQDVYPDLTQERAGLYGAVTARAEAQVLRLSMLYALLDKSSVIDEAHLRAALALWRYCDASAKLIFADGNLEVEDPLSAKLLTALRAASAGLNRRELHQLCQGHVPAVVLVQSLARLRDRGLIEAKLEATGGRKAERWFVRQANDQVATPATAPLPSAPVPEPPAEVFTF